MAFALHGIAQVLFLARQPNITKNLSSKVRQWPSFSYTCPQIFHTNTIHILLGAKKDMCFLTKNAKFNFRKKMLKSVAYLSPFFKNIKAMI